MNAQATLTIPLDYGLTRTPEGGFKAHACLRLATGITMTWCIEVTKAAVDRIMARICAKHGNSFGWNPFKKLKKIVASKVVKTALNYAAKATLLPRAASIASAIAQKTGIPVRPSILKDAFIMAAKAGSGNHAALMQLAKLGKAAAMGNPKAIAAMYAYQAAARHVPILRRLPNPFGAEVTPNPPQPATWGYAPAPALLAMG